ncbi:DUF7021 domain-containing protein [Acetivibrio cellulolyticus]|uniref:DUF7021 domain-containing protein n=1 Tax=Acetivibrio cellulolyticus TaxID=35830 RepID=UPI0001E2F5E1|nr:hypothetical protein [Acetivibrio cellulolyticus]
MSKSSEISRFESRFNGDVIEIAAVTGASGSSAGRAGKDIMWTASIDLIAWKNLCGNEPVVKEDIRLQWMADDEEWGKTRNILGKNTIIRLHVRKSEKSMMLVKILDNTYRDEELEVILQDSMKPVFYNDEVLGEFELDKTVKLFEKKIIWAGERPAIFNKNGFRPFFRIKVFQVDYRKNSFQICKI